jgi:amino acid adenylation domain-containing protein
MSNLTKRLAALSPEQQRLLEMRLAQQGIDISQFQPIRRRDGGAVAPLSFPQQRLWFLDQLEPGCPAYNIHLGLRLEGDLDVEALRYSLNQVVQRHEILRTTFASTDQGPAQVIAESVKLETPLIDLSSLPPWEREQEIQRRAAEEALRPFELLSGPLLRAILLQSGQRERVFLLTMHHIIADGWSIDALLRELAIFYEARVAGFPAPLPEPPIQYADFAVWQRRRLGDDALRAQLDYWRRQLAGAYSVLALPTDRPRPAVQSYRGASQSFSLPQPLSRDLASLSRREEVTLFMTLLAAWVALLHRYTGQGDISLGAPIANRGRAELEGLIGFFANTLALRVRVEGDIAFRELLGRVRDVAVGAFANQDAPFEQVVEALQPARSLSHTPLFQVMFVLHNTPHSAITLRGVSVRPLANGGGTARFDLTLALRETEGGLAGSLEYSADLFEAETIKRLLGHFQELAQGVVAQPDRRIDALPILTGEERRQVLTAWNSPLTNFPEAPPLHRLFQSQVERSPHAIAVTFADEQLTYGELNERANQIAHYLKQLWVGPEVLAGLCLERSAEMVVAILGILKAGGAYLPLDPDWPSERLSFILNDARASVLITKRQCLPKLMSCDARTVCLDSDGQVIARQSRDNPGHDNPADDLTPESPAYAIYTSGSTGSPKGVIVTHANVTRLFEATRQWFDFDDNDVWTLFHSYAFDFSVWELWGALLHGGRLAVVPYLTARSPEAFYEMLGSEGVTVLNQTPSVFRQLMKAEENGGRHKLRSLRLIIFGGEALELHSLRSWFERYGDESPRLVNMYGITETTVHVTYRQLSLTDYQSGGGSVIGKRIPDLRVYILDRRQQPAPVGVPGEIYVGGAGLSRGYLNRPHLTADRFIPDPFSPDSFSNDGGARLYRTGDLAKYLPDGDIEYLGRVDQQIKLMGFRIEPGEVEAALSSHPRVKEAVVMLTDGPHGHKRLTAYVAPDGREPALAVDELRDLVKRRLPEYMAPSAFLFLDEMPLTVNGKIDRRALLTLKAASQEAAPRTEIEKLLAGVWEEILGVERVRVHDNFFELGGHSLLATQVMSRLRTAFGVELPLRCMFDTPTVAGLAAQIETRLKTSWGLTTTPRIERASRDRELPLSFAQERLWFIDRLAPGATSYNIVSALRLSGRLDLSALERSLNEIARRHEILRATFRQSDSEPVQTIWAPRAIELRVLDLSDRAEADREAEVRRIIGEEVRRPFQLSEGPLWRVRLLRLRGEEHVALLAMHHIITDGWSFGVLTRELAALYESFSQGMPSPLPELPIQYADFAVWQRQWLCGETLDAQLDYWRRRLAGAPCLLKLPYDRPRPPGQILRGAKVSFQLSPGLTQSLQKLSRREGGTLFMVLLAVFKILLHRYTRQEDIVVGADMANRNREETEGLIGFFVNMLVLRTDLSGDPSFSELLGRVREVALGAYANQDLPFGKLIEGLHVQRSSNINPLFQVVFVLQNTPAEELRAPGVTITPLPVETEAAQFDLVLAMEERSEGLVGALTYSADLFERATAERMVRHLRKLLEEVVRDPERRLSSLQLMAEEEVRAYSSEQFNSLNLSRKELEDLILEIEEARSE